METLKILMKNSNFQKMSIDRALRFHCTFKIISKL